MYIACSTQAAAIRLQSGWSVPSRSDGPNVQPEMEPGFRVMGHRVTDFGRESAHESMCQTWYLTWFWVLTYTFIVT